MVIGPNISCVATTWLQLEFIDLWREEFGLWLLRISAFGISPERCRGNIFQHLTLGNLHRRFAKASGNKAECVVGMLQHMTDMLLCIRQIRGHRWKPAGVSLN